MTTAKGDNITLSLVPETDGYGKAPTSYSATGKMFQNNDGTFNASRNALESEARTANAELTGVRLGNKQVSGTFPVNLDPKNYSKLFESLFYSRFSTNGSEVTKASNSIVATSKYEVTLGMTSANQTTLAAVVGNAYLIKSIAAPFAHLKGVAILKSKTATTLTFIHPNQIESSITAATVDTVIAPVNNLRPSNNALSFNAEETIVSEDGSTTSRFMSTGVINSGTAIELPSEGILTASFSMIGADHIASSEYNKFDSNLTNSTAAHTSVVGHDSYDPLVLQDGAILDGNNNTLCQWLSGSINIENGAQTYFTGCSFKAKGSFSGNFRVNVTYEALFESEADYVAFEAENTSKMFLRLKDRASDECLVLYIPELKKTGYTRSGGRGLVSASVTGQAIVSADAANSFILAKYHS